MTKLGAALLAWMAVHLFAALISAFLFVRRRQLEQGAYTFIALSLAGYCYGAALVTNAMDPSEAAWGQTIEYCFGTATFVAYAIFGNALVGRPTRSLIRLLMPAAAIVIPCTAAGLLVDPAVGIEIQFELPWAYPYRDAGLTPMTWAAGAAALAFGIWVIVELSRSWNEHREIRILTCAVALTVLGWTHDIAIRGFGIGCVYMTEHLSSLGGLLVSYLLLHRFALTATTLSTRTLELRHRYDELQHVQGELVRKEQLAAVGELSAVIAHEVRNPLAVLKTAAAGLRKDGIGSEDRGTLLGVLDEETDRLNRLVRDLLAYARPVEPQLTDISVDELVSRSIDAARSIVASVGHEPDIDTSGLTGRVRGDKDLLERVIAQIVSNAIEAMPDGGTLTVRSEVIPMGSESGVAIHFEDTGEGMDTLVRERAVDPFFTTRPTGTGLGLAIVERIVKAHGGTVEIQSSDHGSTVSVLLPGH